MDPLEALGQELGLQHLYQPQPRFAHPGMAPPPEGQTPTSEHHSPLDFIMNSDNYYFQRLNFLALGISIFILILAGGVWFWSVLAAAVWVGSKSVGQKKAVRIDTGMQVEKRYTEDPPMQAHGGYYGQLPKLAHNGRYSQSPYDQINQR
jgi:hypothetical protein